MDRMIKDSKTGQFIKHEIPNLCTIEGCNSKVRAKSFCNTHYLRFIRYGSPHIRKKRANGEGGLHASGYRNITVDGIRVLEHRHIMEKHLGRKLKRTEIVHHADGNKLNNSIKNLQIVSRSAHVKCHPESLSNLKLGPKSR